MPQVALGKILDVDEIINKLRYATTEKRPTFTRYIDKISNLIYVENFCEAARDNFKGWCLHHIAGELTDRNTLITKNLYYGQPPHFLIFIRTEEHLSIHHKKPGI